MRVILVIAVSLACATPIVAFDARGDWAKTFDHRAATLKIDLPTFAPMQVGPLTLSPDRGTFYRVGAFSDRSVDALLAKVKTDRRNADALALFGIPFQKPEDTALTYLKAGAPVTIKGLEFKGHDIVFWIWDEFARTKKSAAHLADPASTCFSIEWPTKFSKTFDERAQLDEMVAGVLTLRDGKD